jgi:hypothetical protein
MLLFIVRLVDCKIRWLLLFSIIFFMNEVEVPITKIVYFMNYDMHI